MKVITYDKMKFFSDVGQDYSSLDIVEKILKDVRKNGDAAVKKYTKEFDRYDLNELEITSEEIKKAYKKVDKQTLGSIKKAAKNIEFFAKKQKSIYKEFEVKLKDTVLGQKIMPIERVGCYIPGGRYPLVSTVLMSVIPAKIAGVKEIIVCSPKITPEIIVTADLVGANRIFNIGGVQAIGAMAYGTKSVPKVDKIVGPGNKYVTAAKKYVYGAVGIDFIAGPSELLIIADETSNVKFIAADFLGQMEHDPNAKIYLITTSKKIAEETKNEIEQQIKLLKTKKIAKLSSKNGVIILVKDLFQAIEICNKIAPEHLEIQIKNPESFSKKLKNYGSLFIGNYSAEVFGDYCSGTNHILPTNGASRYTGGLSVGDFLKIVTYQKIGKDSVKEMIEIASKISDIEGLDAHKKSAEIRRN